jgi:endonuclease G, mitochondrial
MTGRGIAAAPYEERLKAANEAAAKRIKARAGDRSKNIELLDKGGIAAANPPERISKRLDRLGRYMRGEDLPIAPADVPEEHEAVLGAVPMRRFTREAAAAGKVLELIINQSDLLGVRYFDGGAAAARAVGRIDVRDRPEHLEAFGTGSLVSPRLVLTNHHVLPDHETAAASAIEFNLQDDINGRELVPQVFGFDPDTFFIADEKNDFALVAVKAKLAELEPFGSNPLIEAEGKGVIGEYVTIIQHPRGLKKQVALRENRFVDIADPFVHYTTDTEPGSSGSPVFNDQWEVVALHHAGIPAPEQKDTGGFVNEGILVRRIMEFVRTQDLSTDARTLIDQIAPRERIDVTATPQAAPASNGHAVQAPIETARPVVTEVTVPLELTIQLRSPSAPPSSPAAPTGEEKIEIDPDYADRKGYDPGFLGDGSLRVNLPTLPPELLDKASTNTKATSEPRYVLPYHHYSVVMNKERRLAFFTAVNIDGSTSRRLKREPDRWSLDPRIPAEDQTGDPVYEHNKLDRGHLVRRLDPAWGESPAVVKIANDDTFHFTNCTPQHKDFNENKASWAGLEDYILENADNLDFKVNVFSGPVLADDDKEYRGVKLPKQFWKVVTMVKSNGQLSATGYVISQEALIDQPIDEKLEVAGDFAFGGFRTYQVPVTRVEQLTALSFGPLSSFDPLAGSPLESAEVTREITSHEDILL